MFYLTMELKLKKDEGLDEIFFFISVLQLHMSLGMGVRT